MIAPADTTTERESAFFSIFAGPWVRHVKRAVLALTISNLLFSSNSLVVAAIAEPLCATAAKESNRAAIHALPVNKVGAMSVLADV